MPPPPPVSQARLEEGLRPGGPPPDEPVSGFVVCMNVTNTITHLLLGAVAFISFIVANWLNVVDLGNLTYTKFTAHIYLSVIGVSTILSIFLLRCSGEAMGAIPSPWPSIKLSLKLQIEKLTNSLHF